MIKQLNQTQTISHAPTTSFQPDRKGVVVSIPASQREVLENLCAAPGHILLDANGSKDLAEYGNRLGLEFSTTKDGETVFIETQKSADDKFTQYLKDTKEEDLLHGDRFLKELLQADITELETEPNFSKVLFGGKENILPLLVLSKKDSSGQFSQEDEVKYKSLLNNLFKVEIENYLNKAPQAREADDYTERIRRILRTNARQIDEDSLPRNLSVAWETETQQRHRMTRKQMLSTAGLGATALFATVLSVLYGDSNDKVNELNRDIIIKTALLKEQTQKLTGKSLSDPDFDSNKSVSLDILLDRLTGADKSKMIFISKEILKQAKISYQFNDQIQILYSIPQPEILDESRRANIEARYSKEYNLLHVVIPKPILDKISKEWNPELGADNARIQVEKYLKLYGIQNLELTMPEYKLKNI